MADDAYIHTINWRDRKPPLGSELDRSHPLSRGLVGCWLFNENGGNLVNDIAGKNNGANVGATWKVSSKGAGLSFNGSSSRVDMNEKTAMMDKNSFSIVGSFSSTDAGTTRATIYNEASVLESTLTNMFIALNDTVNGRLRWFLRDKDNEQFSITSDGNYDDGKPHLFCAVNNNYSLHNLFVDGLLVGTSTTAVNGTWDTITQQNLGVRIQGIDANAGFFNGNILFIYIYNRPLFPQEIQSLYVSPYQFIQPITRRFFSSGETSAPGVTTIYRPNHLTLMGCG